MKVKCSISEGEDEGDSGQPVATTIAVCTRCEHETTSYGTSDASVKRCLVLMREECPNDEKNFYTGGG